MDGENSNKLIEWVDMQSGHFRLINRHLIMQEYNSTKSKQTSWSNFLHSMKNLCYDGRLKK